MHEMGIALEIIDIAAASIPPDMTGCRVARVHVSVGKLAAVVPESLRFCFDVAIDGTPVEGAELVVREVPVTARCQACGHQWSMDGPAFACPACRSAAIDLISGRELDIDSIEVEQKEVPHDSEHS